MDFFGHPARTTPVAALLARRSDVPVLPTLSRRLPDGRHLMVTSRRSPWRRPGMPRRTSKGIWRVQSRAIEAWVRAEPSQWLWLHRRWKNQFPEIYEESYQPSDSNGQPRPK